MADQMIESCLKEFEELKTSYREDMPIDEMAGMLAGVRVLNQKFIKCFELVSLYNLPIDEKWKEAHNECTRACEILAMQLDAKKTANHPIKFLDPLVTQHSDLIRWIDAIQDLWGEDFKDLEISLPRIVVIGEESVGKSSVLESVVGMALFPRAEGICTRLPFQLRLHRKSAERMLKDYNTDSDPIVSFATDPKHFCKDAAEVARRVTEITKEKTGGKGVKDDVVILNVYSRRVTDLTLIDLPGIVNAHREGEPENMHEITVGIVRNYIKEEDTIILAVIPANISLGNSQALREAQKAKALHRTVGVITKVDLAHPRDKVDLKIEGIAPDNVALPNGYIGMVNEDTECKQACGPDEFFQTNYPKLWEQKKVGRTALMEKLTVLLDQHIRNVWAEKTKIKLLSKQKQVKAMLDSLGPPVPQSNVKEFFQAELAKFGAQFRTVLDAKQSTLFLILETKFREAVFAAKKAKNQDLYRDPIAEVLEKADSYIKEEIVRDMLEKCKLTRFPALCENIVTEYNRNTQQAKEEVYNFVKVMLVVNSAELPGSVVCAAESEKPNCPICREEIPLPNKGGTVKLDCRHSMHVECFKNLVEKRAGSECPVCRAKIPHNSEKMPQSASTVDPVLLFVFKAIAKYLLPAAKDKFTTGMEDGFIKTEFEEKVKHTYKETDEISIKRKLYNDQLEVLREALVTVMKYLDAKSLAPT